MTQAALAKEIGISASYLNLIEANKRSVAGALLNRIAHTLKMEVDDLSGIQERRISDDLREIPTEPLLRHFGLAPGIADELVARYPDWARAILTLYRAYLDNSQMIAALTDRLSKDPTLQQSVHQMLTHITSIRSTSEILKEEEELTSREIRHFHNTLNSESADLSAVAQKLVSFLDQQHVEHESLSPAEEVDEFIIGQRNWFPQLESAADDLHKKLINIKQNNLDGALEEFLLEEFSTRVCYPDFDDMENRTYRNLSSYNKKLNELTILPTAPSTTKTFQLAQLATQLNCKEILTQLTADSRLSTLEARNRAEHALSAYIAGAILMPYDEFLDAATSCRYDIDRLSQQFKVSFEQVCHRLVSLRDPNREGIPFALLRVDPSGHITKRFPLYGFPLPRYGHGCPLWVVFSTFQSPQKVVRQLGEFPGGSRFLMLAKSVIKHADSFTQRPLHYSIMLACNELHADKTIYVEGLQLNSPALIDRVGPGCRLCDRNTCQHRQESHVLAVAD
ncbi:MAG: putative transcriptional regulator/transcriptional regulator with XRE-family HTH domain [Gammaproteobacteria bacterium]